MAITRCQRCQALLGPTATALAEPGLIASTAPIASPLEDPVVALYREWVAARREWYRLNDLPGREDLYEAEMDAATNREYAAIDLMTEAGATTLEGIAALAYVLWDLEGPGTVSVPDSPEYLEWISTSANFKLMLAIWRAASGKSGFPPNGRLEG